MKTEDLISDLLVVEKCDELCETTVLFMCVVLSRCSGASAANRRSRAPCTGPSAPAARRATPKWKRQRPLSSRVGDASAFFRLGRSGRSPRLQFSNERKCNRLYSLGKEPLATKRRCFAFFRPEYQLFCSNCTSLAVGHLGIYRWLKFLRPDCMYSFHCGDRKYVQLWAR